MLFNESLDKTANFPGRTGIHFLAQFNERIAIFAVYAYHQLTVFFIGFFTFIVCHSYIA